jgi:hypothetical protein
VVIAAYAFAPWELALPDASASFEITWMPLEPLDSTLSYELQIADPSLDQGTGEFRALDTLLDGPTGHLVASYPRLTKLLVVALD